MQNTPRDERYLQRRLAELEKRIAALETAPRAGNTSISGGTLTVGDPGGDDRIELDAGEGVVRFTQSGAPAGILRALTGTGGGAELEGSAAPNEVLPFATDARVGISGIDAVVQVDAADAADPSHTTSIGALNIGVVYDGTDHAPQVGLSATSQDLPDSAQVSVTASGGMVLSPDRSTDAPWGGAGTVVLYVKSNRLYYRDGTNVVRGPL